MVRNQNDKGEVTHPRGPIKTAFVPQTFRAIKNSMTADAVKVSTLKILKIRISLVPRNEAILFRPMIISACPGGLASAKFPESSTQP